MIIVRAQYQVKAGQRDALLQEMKEKDIKARYEKQPGNVCFAFALPIDNDQVLELVDIWENDEVFEAHMHCDATPDWGALKAKYVEKDEFTIYRAERDDAYFKKLFPDRG